MVNILLKISVLLFAGWLVHTACMIGTMMASDHEDLTTWELVKVFFIPFYFIGKINKIE